MILEKPHKTVIIKEHPCKLLMPITDSFIPSLWSENAKLESETNFLENNPNVIISNGSLSSIITISKLTKLLNGSYKIEGKIINDEVYDLRNDESNLTITIQDGYITKTASLFLKSLKIHLKII